MSILKRLLKCLRDLLAPQPEPADSFIRHDSSLAEDKVTVRQIQKAILNHFNASVEELSSDYNFLYDTSFTIYLKAKNYSEMSNAIPFWASGAEKMLVNAVKSRTALIPGYIPHSQYWQFQLVEIPDNAALDGITEEEMSDGAFIQISSTLFPPSEAGEEPDRGDQRVVTTVQSVNSLRAIRNCINPEILSKLYLIEKDRIKLELVLDDNSRKQDTDTGRQTASPKIGNSRPSTSKSNNSNQTYSLIIAKLVAEDGEFLDGPANRKIHTLAMTAGELHISGRSAMPCSGTVETARVNSDRVLTPHAKIKRDPATGRFLIAAIGPTTLNEINLDCNPEAWRPLPTNSTIMLADEIQIKFTTVKRP